MIIYEKSRDLEGEDCGIFEGAIVTFEWKE
jgi:hypothetical protein